MGRPQTVVSVEALPNELHRQSGIYVIYSKQTGKCLYVGESHTNTLKKTILRHFQLWGLDHFHKTARATYDRNRVSVYVETTAPGSAFERQNDLICELNPRDNEQLPACDPF
jgi:hypothetical protein